MAVIYVNKTGMVMRKTEVVLDVEPNSDEKIVKFEEMGHFKYKSQKYADLYINIETSPHPIYTK